MVNLTKKFLRFLPLNFTKVTSAREIEVGRFAVFPEGFQGTNPSMVAVEGGYLVSIRGVNYRLKSGKVSDSAFTVGDRFMSVNRFMLLDPDFGFQRALPGLDDIFNDVEDIKLFYHAGRVMGFGSCPTTGQTGKYDRSGCIITLDDELDGGSILPLASPYGFRQEKNWAPFTVGNELHFIYSFDPLVVLRFDAATRAIGMAASQPADVTKDGLKFLFGGSSAGIPVANGYLFAAHRRRVSLPRLDHNYVTCLYFFEPSKTRLERGPFFSIGPASVQFVNGLVLTNRKIFVSFGNKDATAQICQLPETLLPPSLREAF